MSSNECFQKYVFILASRFPALPTMATPLAETKSIRQADIISSSRASFMVSTWTSICLEMEMWVSFVMLLIQQETTRDLLGCLPNIIIVIFLHIIGLVNRTHNLKTRIPPSPRLDCGSLQLLCKTQSSQPDRTQITPDLWETICE